MAEFEKFETEREGQVAFFDTFGIDYRNEPILVEKTDGISHGGGVLFEFKLVINDLNKVLFQAIKYLSHLRLHGKNVPANILLVSLNTKTAYHYRSEDYFKDIHKVYYVAASKQNEGFLAQDPADIWHYDGDDADGIKMLLKSDKDEATKKPSKNFMPIDIDENCIVPWAERFYKERSTAQKGDFIGVGDKNGKVKVVGEIRKPVHFKGIINPYKGKTNEKFKYLMDKLNERLRQKDAGAFYTPVPYCKKAAELLKEAIARVPDGNDYIILDRCAGTGNLEAVLDEDILSHCVLATYEYYEYKVLCERLGDKVKHIIPPIDDQVQYESGYIANANAMTEEFVTNEYVKKFIDDPNCTIILYENPPYSEATSTEHQKSGTGKTSSAWKNDFVPKAMVQDIKDRNKQYKKLYGHREIEGRSSNEKANAFIWSAFKYYLRQPTDSYVLFSPIKYWKYQHLISKRFMNGFVFNRKWFHASQSAITCILWANEDDYSRKELRLELFDIEPGTTAENATLKSLNAFLEIRKTQSLLSDLYDKRVFDGDVDGIACDMDGQEAFTKKVTAKPKYNENIIGYLKAKEAGFEHPGLCTNLIRCVEYDAHGFYLRKDKYREKLPLFCAGLYPVSKVWFRSGIVYKSADGGEKFVDDSEFLDDCLIFTCLSSRNRCRSFKGSDGRFYKNELCFDRDTLASDALGKIEQSDMEKELIKIYKRILKEATKTKNYNKEYSYGVYQIDKELNTFIKDEMGETIYDYPKLNADLDTLRIKLMEYYMKNIVPKLFEYQLLK